MTYDASLLNYFLQASLVVKCVMLILFGASIFSWTYILQRIFYLQDVTKAANKFEKSFWAGEDIPKLYLESSKRQGTLEGIEAIFHAGYQEFLRFRKQSGINPNLILENTQRAMRATQKREQERLETHLPFLAMVGSASPYVGLLGTVWGIMQALKALANVQQATISMVAPGIAEALVATALGLFAAIPAVIAYNRLINNIGGLTNRFDAFQEEFSNILMRQTQQIPISESVEA